MKYESTASMYDYNYMLLVGLNSLNITLCLTESITDILNDSTH